MPRPVLLTAHSKILASTTHTVQAQTADNSGLSRARYHLRDDAQGHEPSRGRALPLEEGSFGILHRQVQIIWAPAPLHVNNLHARCSCASVERARGIPVASTSLVIVDNEALRTRPLVFVVTDLANVSARVETSRLVCSSLGHSSFSRNIWEPLCPPPPPTALNLDELRMHTSECDR